MGGPHEPTLFAAELRAALGDRRLSLEELARCIDVAEVAVDRWRRGDELPSLVLLGRLMALLDRTGIASERRAALDQAYRLACLDHLLSGQPLPGDLTRCLAPDLLEVTRDQRGWLLRRHGAPRLTDVEAALRPFVESAGSWRSPNDGEFIAALNDLLGTWAELDPPRSPEEDWPDLDGLVARAERLAATGGAGAAAWDEYRAALRGEMAAEKAERAVRLLLAGGLAQRWTALPVLSDDPPQRRAVALACAALWSLVEANKLPKACLDALARLSSPAVAAATAGARGERLPSARAAALRSALATPEVLPGLRALLADLDDEERGGGVLQDLALSAKLPSSRSAAPPAGARGGVLGGLLGAAAVTTAKEAYGGLVGGRAEEAYKTFLTWLQSGPAVAAAGERPTPGPTPEPTPSATPEPYPGPWPGGRGRLESKIERMLAEPDVNKRVAWFRRLGQEGRDTRPGVGVRDGVPDLVWCRVPKGGFRMGGDPAAFNAWAGRWVELKYDYWVARYPVTYAQYEVFVAAGGYTASRWRDCWTGAGREWKGNGTQPHWHWNDPEWHISNHPVVGVSWYEAWAYTQWLERLRWAKRLALPAEILSGHVIRLATEAEWERAARYPDGRFYPWGNEDISGAANIREIVDSGDLQHPSPDSQERTTAVGIYRAGRQEKLGIDDLSGNV
jgi:formylglycine-generating enzyme required for sulfatase activity/transcriptional regulator with XRE-family HTH domain